MISRVLNFLRRGKQRLLWELRPAHYRVIRDIDYLSPSSAEKADLYLPKSPTAKPTPAIVVIHGGGWVEGDKRELRELSICGDLANHGYIVLAINYTLLKEGDPTTLWPRNLHECKTAVRWLRANAGAYGIDPERIGVLGESAGGQLATMVALTAPEHGLDPAGPYGEFSCRVQAGVNFYGLVDFRRRTKTLALLDKSPTEAPELYAQACPFSYGRPGDPPLLIIHGTADSVVRVEQSQDLAAALAQAGAPHELVLVPEGTHAFDLRPKEMDLRPTVFNFFDKHLKSIVLMALAWACCPVAIQADDAAKLVDLGTYFDNPKGELIIQLTGDVPVWQNGRVLISRPFPDCSMMDEAFLKPGDILVIGGPDGFSRYQLERLSRKKADFAIWRYVSVSTTAHHYCPGKLLSVETAKIDLPLEITDDSRPNLLELSHGPAPRTK